MQKILAKLKPDGLNAYHSTVDDADAVIVFGFDAIRESLQTFAAGSCKREELRLLLSGAAHHIKCQAGNDPLLLTVVSRVEGALKMLEAHTDCSLCGHACSSGISPIRQQ